MAILAALADQALFGASFGRWTVAMPGLFALCWTAALLVAVPGARRGAAAVAGGAAIVFGLVLIDDPSLLGWVLFWSALSLAALLPYRRFDDAARWALRLARVDITVSEGDGVTVAVSDDGPGVPPADRERIFEPFFTTRRAENGTGLGLPIVRLLLAMAGGDRAGAVRGARGSRWSLRVAKINDAISGGTVDWVRAEARRTRRWRCFGGWCARVSSGKKIRSAAAICCVLCASARTNYPFAYLVPRRRGAYLADTMSAEPPPLRKVIHIDMDAFYASVEQRDDPSLRGRPVAVGGSRARGVVAAASYEARVFGVKSAMPSVTALRRCPDLVFVPPRFDAYRSVSQQIRAIFADYTALIEPLSLDEAYLDVTEDVRGLGSARAIAEEIRARIKAETGLTASAGVSYNKFIAKLASDQNKPDGICVIPPAKGAAFVAGLPVRRFHGVGPVTAAKMERLGIATGADLRAQPIEMLRSAFGSSADYLFGAARGIDERPVRADRATKSVGAERTFEQDLTERTDLLAALDRVAEAAWVRVERSGARGRTVTLKLRFADFRTITRARSSGAAVADFAGFLGAGVALLEAQLPVAAGVRLLGLTLSGIVEGDAAEEQAVLPL